LVRQTEGPSALPDRVTNGQVDAEIPCSGDKVDPPVRRLRWRLSLLLYVVVPEVAVTAMAVLVARSDAHPSGDTTRRREREPGAARGPLFIPLERQPG
jgi:hypothetical protein